MTLEEARIWRLEREIISLNTTIETLERKLLAKTISNPDFNLKLEDIYVKYEYVKPDNKPNKN